MIRVVCHSNLDLTYEVWPLVLPEKPSIGDKVESKTVWTNGFRLVLKIVDIIWRYDEYRDEYSLFIELHDFWPVPRSIADFHDWYKACKGR